MNRNQKIRIAMIVCAAALIAAVVLAATNILGTGLGYGYANAEKYTAGEAEIPQAVRNLDVDWTEGSVTLEYHDLDTVLIRETADKTIGEDLRVRWWLDGDTLRVRYARPGLRLSLNLNKKLVLTLPRDAEMGAVSLSAASADLIVPSLKAESLKMEAASGNIRAEAAVKTLTSETASGKQSLKTTGRAEVIRASAASGDIAIETEGAGVLTASLASGRLTVVAAGESGEVSLSSASGEIRAEVGTAETFSASSSSGSIDAVIGKAGKVALSAASGNVNISLGQAEKAEISTASGRVTAALPTVPGFTAKIETASGRIENEIPLTVSGKTYACGDGSASVSIHTASGNILLKERQE